MNTEFWSGTNIDCLTYTYIYIFTSSSIWWSHQGKNSPWVDFLCEAPQHCSLGTFCKAHFIRFTRWWPTGVTEETKMAPSFSCSCQSPRAHIRTWGTMLPVFSWRLIKKGPSLRPVPGVGITLTAQTSTEKPHCLWKCVLSTKWALVLDLLQEPSSTHGTRQTRVKSDLKSQEQQQ